MIDYLPKNIPRLLINRTIVHPKHVTAESDEEDDPREKEFRENYVFDAYLLGFCDVVTRSLAKYLFSKEAPSSQGAVKAAGCSSLAALKSDDDEFRVNEWKSTVVPRERVFLFPGAQPPTTLDDNEPAEDAVYCEIAHCDGCSLLVESVVHKCKECFDYDLCASCYPKLSKKHFDGTHHFHRENVQ